MSDQTWSCSNLLKLAKLEKMSIEFLDEFIESRTGRGDADGVAMKRFPGQVAWAHDYNLRDYIGRTEPLIYNFITERPYLWNIDNGNVVVVPKRSRRVLVESAIYMNGNGEKRQATLTELLSILEVKGVLGKWPPHFIKMMLQQYPELFEMEQDADDDDRIIFSCLVLTVDETILPRSVSKFTSAMSAFLATLPSASRSAASSVDGSSGTNSETLEGVGTVTTVNSRFGFINFQNKGDVYFHLTCFDEPPAGPLDSYVRMGDQLYFRATISPYFEAGEDIAKWRADFVTKKLSRGGAAATAIRKKEASPDEHLEGIGTVIAVYERHGFLRYAKNDDICFHISAFDVHVPEPLSTFVKTGDQLYFKAFLYDEKKKPKYGNKWRASYISKSLPAPKSTKNTAVKVSGDGWVTVSGKTPQKVSASGSSRIASMIASDSGENFENASIRNESRARPIKTPEPDPCYNVSLADIDNELDGISEVEKVAPPTPNSEPEPTITFADMACQTDTTDEEILLRILRACPQLLDPYILVKK